LIPSKLGKTCYSGWADSFQSSFKHELCVWANIIFINTLTSDMYSGVSLDFGTWFEGITSCAFARWLGLVPFGGVRGPAGVRIAMGREAHAPTHNDPAGAHARVQPPARPLLPTGGGGHNRGQSAQSATGWQSQICPVSF